MIKTVVKSVRLPDTLFHLVMSCNQGKTFTQIVIELLSKEYSFSIPCKQEENPSCKQEEVIDPNIIIENEIDKMLNDKKRRVK